MKEYLSFEKMVTPVVIKVLFWVLVVGSIIGGIVMFTQNQAGTGLIMILVVPLIIRIYAELLMIMFQIHDRLFEIRGLLEKKEKN